MSHFAQLAALAVGCYALGCLVSAYYLVQWRTGQDLRTVGSGNAGARNAARVLGRAGFTASLIIDAGKGALAIGLALQLGARPVAVAIAMTAVVVGHIWPAQLGFRGGKGAATALGIMMVFDPLAMALLIVAGLVLLAATRRFTLSGLAAIALAPAAAAWRGHEALEVTGLAIVAAVVVYAHRSNLLALRTARGDAPSVLHQESTR